MTALVFVKKKWLGKGKKRILSFICLRDNFLIFKWRMWKIKLPPFRKSTKSRDHKSVPIIERPKDNIQLQATQMVKNINLAFYTLIFYWINKHILIPTSCSLCWLVGVLPWQIVIINLTSNFLKFKI